jgi:hypothetical protein
MNQYFIINKEIEMAKEVKEVKKEEVKKVEVKDNAVYLKKSTPAFYEKK